MKPELVDAFLAANAANYPAEAQAEMRAKLLNLPDDKAAAVQALSPKKPTTMFLIAFFLGGYGVDRFMLGQTGLGVAKLLTCGGCGIWAIVDWFSAKKRAQEYNLAKFNETVG